MVSHRDAHHRRHDVKCEHRKLEPIDAELPKINRQTEKRDGCGANEKRTGGPVDAVEGDTVHESECAEVIRPHRLTVENEFRKLMFPFSLFYRLDILSPIRHFAPPDFRIGDTNITTN